MQNSKETNQAKNPELSTIKEKPHNAFDGSMKKLKAMYNIV